MHQEAVEGLNELMNDLKLVSIHCNSCDDSFAVGTHLEGLEDMSKMPKVRLIVTQSEKYPRFLSRYFSYLADETLKNEIVIKVLSSLRKRLDHLSMDYYLGAWKSIEIANIATDTQFPDELMLPFREQYSPKFKTICDC